MDKAFRPEKSVPCPAGQGIQLRSAGWRAVHLHMKKAPLERIRDTREVIAIMIFAFFIEIQTSCTGNSVFR